MIGDNLIEVIWISAGW